VKLNKGVDVKSLFLRMMFCVFFSVCFSSVCLAKSAIYKVDVTYQPEGSSSQVTKIFKSDTMISHEPGTEMEITIYRQSQMSGKSYFSCRSSDNSFARTLGNTADYCKFQRVLSGIDTDPLYIGCGVDPNGESGYESDEIAIWFGKADLRLEAVTVNSFSSVRDYSVGETVELGCEVKNYGGYDDVDSYVGYYIGTSSLDMSNRKKSDKVCPMNIEVSMHEQVRNGQCINCMKCVQACPVNNTLSYSRVKLPIGKNKN
jgi:NAD-dependent dihydropyrimidine dehydrogenase PreA subunit